MLGVSAEVWKRTLYIGSLRCELILACQEVLNHVWPSMNWYRMLSIQTSSPTTSMLWKLTKHGKCCMQSNQLSPKSPVLKDNSTVSLELCLEYINCRLQHGKEWWCALISVSRWGCIGRVRGSWESWKRRASTCSLVRSESPFNPVGLYFAICTCCVEKAVLGLASVTNV